MSCSVRTSQSTVNSMDTVREYIDHHAANTPDSVFLITPLDETSECEELTFGHLKTRVDLIAEKLAALGIERGDKVAFLMSNGQWTVQLFLGVMACGRVIVPINAVAGETQMLHVLNHCDAGVVFVAPEFKETLAGLVVKSDRDISMIEVSASDGPLWPEFKDGLKANSEPVPVSYTHLTLPTKA